MGKCDDPIFTREYRIVQPAEIFGVHRRKKTKTQPDSRTPDKMLVLTMNDALKKEVSDRNDPTLCPSGCDLIGSVAVFSNTKWRFFDHTWSEGFWEKDANGHDIRKRYHYKILCRAKIKLTIYAKFCEERWLGDKESWFVAEEDPEDMLAHYRESGEIKGDWEGSPEGADSKSV